MLVVPAIQTLQTHPQHWGEDSLEWRPQRWILDATPNPTTSTTSGASLESETLFSPLKGTFFPWAEGARNCPGKKFAYVEIVAILASLLWNHRADPVPQAGESIVEARRRILEVVKDSSVMLMLKMRDPESVAIRWSEVR